MYENEKYLLKMKQDMSLKNFTQSTSEDYYRFVLRFLNFTGKEAMSITYADIRRFIFHMKDEEHKKASTVNCYTAAIRFFFEYTPGYVWDSKKIPKMKRDHRLPAILTREQVQQLVDATENYKHKAILAVIYSSGLRVSEACCLRYDDISRSKKTVYISKAKNRQDRYSILSDRCLEILTEYWYRYGRPRGWLFPGTVRDEPLTTESVRKFMKAQVRQPGFPQNVAPHSLRHSFAVHLLEDGVSQTLIQQLLGHRSPSSANHYLQMTSKALMGIQSPFDRITGEGGDGQH